MKTMKKTLSLVLAIVMALALAMPAMALTTGDTCTYTGTDKTTDGEIALTNATKDVTYSLFKIFDATYSGDAVSYTVPAGDLKTELTTNGGDYFTVSANADANGNFTVSRTMQPAPIDNKPVKTDAELIQYIEGLNTSLFTSFDPIKSTVNGEIKWEKIPYGYYYIKPDQPESDAVVTIDSNTPTVNVIDKNQKPTFDKNIKDEDELVKFNEAGLAIDVPFDITVNAKNYDGTKKIYQYIIKDTIDPGFTYKNDLVVKIGEAGSTLTEKTAGTDYTINYYTDATKTTPVTVAADATVIPATAQYFEIVINWTDDGTFGGDFLYSANSTINVTYNAFLDPAKASQVKVGTNANDNKATVDYKEKENTDSDEVTGTLPESKTETFDTYVEITKTNGSAILPGAEFTLTSTDGTKVTFVTGESFVENASATTKYYPLTDGTYTTTAPTELTANQYVGGMSAKVYEKVTTVTVGENQTAGTTMKGFVDSTTGKLKFSGLGAGTYTISETVVPKGYNKAADITFTLTFNTEEKIAGEGGTQVDNPKYKQFESDNENVQPGSIASVFETTVVNNQGTEMPSTGGIGTKIFYTMGAVLVIGAGVVLVSRKRAGE